MNQLLRFILCAGLAMLVPLAFAVPPPRTISYQGTLTSGGTPFNSGPGGVVMTFRLYDLETGGAPVWTETQMQVIVSNGIFKTLIGSSTPIPITLLFDQAYWLTVEVNSDGEMLPRQPLASSPYAFRAAWADAVTPGGTLTASQFTTTGNLTLVNPSTSSSVGNIMKGTHRFIHNYGIGNTFIGEGAGNFTMTGQNNTASGFGGLFSNSSGNSNTASGAYALDANTTGSSNTATGTFALESNTTGSQNTATGVDALEHNISGNGNTANGVQALFTNFGGNDNTALGASALRSNFFGSKNTATGSIALQNNTSGSDNTANGWNALGSNTTGIRNTAIGQSALFGNTTGHDNTASGISALGVNTTGNGNTASGATALLWNTSGGNNTASGSLALVYNVTGNGNTAVGNGALYVAGRTVTAGTFVPGVSYTIQSTGNTDFSLIGGSVFSSVGDVFVASGPGTGTGTAASNTNNNIALGANAGSNLTTGGDNIDIGHGGFADESNTIRIGQSQTRTFIAGIGMVSSGAQVVVSGSGQLGVLGSSRRFKDNIADMGGASSALMALRPVTFHYKADQNPAGRALQYGLIAEEVAEVYPGLVTHSADGKIETVLYQYLPPMLLNEVQKQQRIIETQAARISVLEQQSSRMESLESELQTIKAMLGAR